MDFSEIKSITIPEGEVKQIAIGDTVIWKGGYTNLVLTATDENGAILNNVGYADGYRINSSGVIKEQAGTAMTGYIEITPNDKDIIRVKGVTMNSVSYYTGIAFFDENYTTLVVLRQATATAAEPSKIYSVSPSPCQITGSSIIDGSDGIATIHINYNENSEHYSRIKYFRIFGVGKGADMIVTINEEITE